MYCFVLFFSFYTVLQLTNERFKFFVLCLKGETTVKTNSVINAARGATLLIDEAYELSVPDSPRDFGREAIETIMACIEGGDTTEDDRPAFIFAGYPIDMERLIGTNLGLKRRVTDTFSFDNYSIQELYEIFVHMARRQNFVVDVDIDEGIAHMCNCFPLEMCTLYNAGISREMFSAAKSSVNKRVLSCLSNDVEKSKRELMCITHIDFVSGCEAVKNKLFK